MHTVNITELRSHLPQYLSNAQKGTEIAVTLHGRVIARIMPPVDTKQEAQKKLHQLRKHCQVGDVVSPSQEKWEAEQ